MFGQMYYKSAQILTSGHLNNPLATEKSGNSSSSSPSNSRETGPLWQENCLDYLSTMKASACVYFKHGIKSESFLLSSGMKAISAQECSGAHDRVKPFTART